nr:uncharacterized protein LOC110358139 isoform X2 [Columba livia]XP_021142100.1 uncharacterized protein LOC110358139 isoform X2 [Columba livia]
MSGEREEVCAVQKLLATFFHLRLSSIRMAVLLDLQSDTNHNFSLYTRVLGLAKASVKYGLYPSKRSNRSPRKHTFPAQNSKWSQLPNASYDETPFSCSQFYQTALQCAISANGLSPSSGWTQQGINSVEVSLPEPEEVKPEHPRCPPWPWHLCSSISSDLLWFLVSNLLAGALGGVQWTLDQALGMSRGQKRKERLYFNIPCSLAACGIIATSYWISASLCVMFILKRSLSSLAKQRDFSGEGMAGSRSRRLSVKCYIDDKILKEPVRVLVETKPLRSLKTLGTLWFSDSDRYAHALGEQIPLSPWLVARGGRCATSAAALLALCRRERANAPLGCGSAWVLDTLTRGFVIFLASPLSPCCPHSDWAVCVCQALLEHPAWCMWCS